ncbi:hypothetical protein EMIHUDRAFT_69043 [Emiliania huxleyi CCMP1516]|uniref:Histidine ammonia-lyase n=2 Tax=Emiliania huxleyi TaxID=2903 RepID=A0A0D3I0S8_EMIH1|nr:hypothetical protein EMIHUDRAFT_69043 [Emiliania huxleyi CCMP1516]EOD04863.1 hypothetical protein EMIHUDRAFT_69043 [Emiliania huxleyi CCMP1516]|eukprot:XP_005757292.1 hypothetical protein EMIHUDRAFT_69043 [Emiliania huxleyi CCMP1516]
MATLLDGETLTTATLHELGEKQRGSVALDPTAKARVEASREIVDRIVSTDEVVYGINTGFGLFSNVTVSADKLCALQDNLIRSHSAGCGEPLTRERSRRLLALRINVLAKGHSGIRAEVLEQMIAAFNADCIPVVPSKGTVGASGDLAPLSHIALGLMGEGDMWDPQGGIAPAAEVLARANLTPIRLGAKEGLAMINGTQLIASLGAEAVERAGRAARLADYIAALSLEVLCGTNRAFDPLIHCVRPHSGQMESAARVRSVLMPTAPSELCMSHPKQVQDAYSLRCVPQVHGITQDTIEFVRRILNTELNSATDNPMVFTQEQGGGLIISGGNFHGEYPAKVLDFLAIAVTEIANIAERRIERLCNPSLSGLPAFLVADGGFNSGFMIAHCTAAALASENKVLCHPSSVDTISTSAAKEDHVSMGGFAARKALEVVQNVETVLAIELLAACQGLEFHRPLKTTKPLENLHALVRKHVRPWDGDRQMSPDIEAALRLVQSGEALRAVEQGLGA